MGWCPSCGYEYRPEVQRCPSCDVALVAEPPAAAPRVAGPQVEPATPRYLSRFAGLRAAFAADIQLARNAAGMTFRAKKLLLVVALLATLYFAGSLTSGYTYRRPSAQGNPGLLFPPNPEPTSALRLWWQIFPYNISLSYLLKEFHDPLNDVASFLSPWISITLGVSYVTTPTNRRRPAEAGPGYD